MSKTDLFPPLFAANPVFYKAEEKSAPEGINWIFALPDGRLSARDDLGLNAEISENLKHFHEKTFLMTSASGQKILVSRLEGTKEAWSLLDWQKAGGRTWSKVLSYQKVNLLLSALDAWEAEAFVKGFMLRNDQFKPYRIKKPMTKIHTDALYFVTPHAKSLQDFITRELALVESVHWARHMTNHPANIVYPQSFVEEVKGWEKWGIKVTVLNKEELEKQKFGALLGVGQASTKPSYLLILEWDGVKDGRKPFAVVGKGVTFDSGGLSLKPSRSMEDMKGDMAGAAVACGLIRDIALRKAKVRAIACVALVENMVSGDSMRPGDIITSLSGQTIEVLNTDAEGRLILADAMWYTQTTFDPETMVLIATLTGGARAALGSLFAAVFGHQEVIKGLKKSGEKVGERVWELPLDPAYDKLLDAQYADIQNIAPEGSGASSITAAQFLKRFVKTEQWAHIDIAAVSETRGETALCPPGATGYGLALLEDYLLSQEA